MHPGDGKASVVPGTRSIKAQTTPSRERLFYESEERAASAPPAANRWAGTKSQHGNVSVQHVWGISRPAHVWGKG